MSINRRCDSVILDYARKVIESNPNRIIKPINGLHKGGSVDVRYYYNEVDEISHIIEDLRKIGSGSTLRRTVICYRNIISSQFLAVKLLEAGIPFNIIRGIKPFTDIFSSSIEDMLILLEHPNVPQYAEKVLYKYVPKGSGFTKESLKGIFRKHIEEMKTAKKGVYIENKPFWEMDFGEWKTINGFTNAINNLKKAHIAIKNNQSMNVFMPIIIGQLRKYYIDSLLKGFYSDKLTKDYISFIEKFYSKDVFYNTFRKDLSKLKEDCKENEADGVLLTTMHGLKGLEFDNVILIDMNDNLYPGKELKNKNFLEEQRQKIEWEARRLLYVTITRARHNMIIYFSSNCPSRYIKFFEDNEDLTELYRKAQNMYKESFKMEDEIPQINELYKDDEFIFEDDVRSNMLTVVQPINNKNDKTKEENELIGLYDELYDDVFNDDSDDKESDDLFEYLDDIRDDVFKNDSDNVNDNKLSWAENPDDKNYKPNLGLMLNLLRGE